MARSVAFAFSVIRPYVVFLDEPREFTRGEEAIVKGA
jgi:hypothetical protein